MSKIDDKQQHTVITTLGGSVVLDAPLGVIALEGSDAPNASPTAAANSAGKTVSIITAGVRLVNPS